MNGESKLLVAWIVAPGAGVTPGAVTIGSPTACTTSPCWERMLCAEARAAASDKMERPKSDVLVRVVFIGRTKVRVRSWRYRAGRNEVPKPGSMAGGIRLR